MNIKDLTSFVKKHLISLNIKKNDNIVVHADISSFGIYHPKLPNIIIKSILSLIGKRGTMALPAYNTTLNKKKIINIKKNFSKKENSILSKYFLKNYKHVKTNSLFHSHMVKGYLENNFKNNINYNYFGKNSDFEIFNFNNFKLLLLGCDAARGCTYLHHIEDKTKKNYRFNKIINFKIKIKNKILKKNIVYKIRKKNILLNFNKIFFLPSVKKITKVSYLKFGASYLVNIKKFDEVCSKILKDKPNILVK